MFKCASAEDEEVMLEGLDLVRQKTVQSPDSRRLSLKPGMTKPWRAILPCLAAALFTLGGTQAQAQVSVLTRNYNNQRTGANLSETVLNTSNVNAGQFGKLFSLAVDDQVFSAVLYVSSLQIAGGTHNVVYVTTVNNSVYAFDADTPGPPLWSRNLNGTGRPTTNAEVGCQPGYNNFLGNIGIVGTPVIDGSSGTIYFVTRTVENGNTVQRLRALDITTGVDRPNSPQIIQASVSTTGGTGTSVVFNANIQNQRSALALSNGVVYIAWASFCDIGPYHGWVMAYNATSLAQVGVFNDSPNGAMGGIWMAGAGPALDASGNLYYGTGNGTFDGVVSYGESLVKLSAGSLGPVDFFAPSSFDNLNAADLDFGSAGPTILPGTNLIVQGGKTGVVYLLNTTNLGHEAGGDTQIPQFFQAVDTTVRSSATHHIHNASPFWNSPEGPNLYVWGENDFLHIYRFNSTGQKFTAAPAFTGSILPPIGMPGGMLTISANGSQAGTGIVWATLPRYGDASCCDVPGNLYAFNAENLALLWSSTGTGQGFLNFSKGSIPVVANGKVYAGSISRFVQVYGLNSSAPPSQNLALNKITTSSTPCSSSQTAAQAVNGSFSGGLNDKWCSSVSNPWMMVDLGGSFNLSRVVVEHAGSGGEAFNLNTRAFNIQVSTDGVNFTQVANVTTNVDSITTHDFSPVTARFVRLNVITPTQTADTSARIYEFEVFASPAGASANFAVSVQPESQNVTTGFTTTFTSSAIALNGFNGPITWSASGLPTGATISFNPVSVNGSGDSITTISTTPATPPGTYTITITGTSGSLHNSDTLALTIIQGGQVDLSSVYNRLAIVTDGSSFSGAGGIDLVGNAYSANLLGRTLVFNGLPYSFGPANVSNAISNKTVPLPSGTFTSLGLLATAVNGTKTSQNFTVTYADGSTTVFTQSLSDWGSPQGYDGESVALTMPYRDVFNGGQDHRNFNLYAYSFTLDPKPVQSLTLPSNTSVVVLAISTVSASTPDFALSASPGSKTVSAGTAANYTATLATVNGFSGTVALTASGLPAGAAATFTPPSFSGSGSTSTLKITTQSTTAAGTYLITINGVSGALQHSTSATLIVTAGTQTATQVDLSPSYNRGGMVTDGSTFAANGGLDLKGFAYSANLLGSTATFQGLPFSLGPANTPDAVSSTTIALPPGQYSSLTMLASGVNGNQPGQTFTVTYSDNTGSVFTQSISDWFTPQNYTGESVAMTMGYRDQSTGVKDGRLFNLYGYAFTLDPARTATSITLPGNANVVALAMTLISSGPVPDFSISASPASQTVTPGSGTSYTATVTAINGFTGNVTLSATGLPAGATPSFTTNPLNGSGTSTLGITTTSATPAGSYTVTVTGTAGSLQHSTTVTLNVADFSISASPGSQTVTKGNATSYTATIAALNGFTGNVTLSATGLPAGATPSFTTNPVTGSGTSTLGITTTSATPAGSYTVTVTGTAGSLQHSTTVTLNVADFSISASPGSQTVTKGNATSYTATIAALSGFTGNVTLSATGLPAGATPSFTTNPVTGSGTSTLGITTTSATPAGSYTITVTGTAGSLQHSTTVTLNVADFSISASPGSQTVTAGSGTSYTATIGALSGFTGNVTLSATGLPAGATPSFTTNPVNGGSGTSTLGITTTSATAVGTYTVTITGTSGSLQHSATATLVVSGGGSSGTTAVDLSSAYNRVGIVTDGTTFSATGGLDLTGNAYSASLLASPVSFQGLSFTLGAANATNSVSNATIGLPAGQYSKLAMLATGANGNQPSQIFTVKYTDGTTSTFTQSLSDWFTPQNYTGESVAVPMGYRDQNTGNKDNRTFYLFEYSFTIDLSKTVSSITLPNNPNVVVLAIVLTTGANAQVNLSSAYNRSGIVTDGTTFAATDGLDMKGYSYSANLLGSSVNFQGVPFALGPANAPDAVSSATIPLPAGQFSTLTILASGVNGNQTAQTFTVTYADNTTAVFTRSLSDWFIPQGYTGETRAVTMGYRDQSTGAKDNRTFYLYGYSLALSPGKALSSITLPNNQNVVVLSMMLTP